MADNDEIFEAWWDATPEGKLELIDGRLLISSLAGSRRILWTVLRDYGPALVLPMADQALWWQALQQAFAPQPLPSSPEAWAAWADTVNHDPEPEPAGPRGSGPHYNVYQLLWFALPHLLDSAGQGRSLGRDFVIKLGEHGVTPDELVVGRDRLEDLHEYYLDGPPSIVIEIAQPGTADMDHYRKWELYEQAKVPEYWLIEPETEEIFFWQLDKDGRYQPATANHTGIYYATAVPGLALSLPDLWSMKEHDWQNLFRPFLPPLTTDSRPLPKREKEPDDLGWDAIPFAPRLDLQPMSIRFEEFISWCPRAKFEHYGGGIKIDGREGTRRVTGMLLMSFGLTEVVKLAHPREWVMFLLAERYKTAVQPQKTRLLAQVTYRAEEISPGDVYFYGEIPALPDLTSYGDSLDQCKREMALRVHDWVMLRLARREEIP